MPLEIISGNIFTTSHQTIVNTVNCVGVMGAGIALECRLRYPTMFSRYCELCEQKVLQPGKLWLYKGGAKDDIDTHWILNFPTKKHWKFPSKIEYITDGLKRFLETYHDKEIKSIAFPVLGTQNGGLDQEEVLQIMSQYLSQCDIPVTIYQYSATSHDDCYELLKKKILHSSIEQLAKETRIRRTTLLKLIQGLNNPQIYQLNQLSRLDGIGIKTLEALFQYSKKIQNIYEQETFF